MAATFGITDLDGFTIPAGCTERRVSSKNSISNVKRRGPTGITIRNIPTKVRTVEQTIEMDGVAPLTLLEAGAFVADTFKVVRVRNRENNDGVPESTVVRKKYLTTA